MKTSSLARGVYSFEEITRGIESGIYEFARIRTHVGQVVPLIGVSPEQYALLIKLAECYGLSIILYGSRVAGPRIRQRALHPVLQNGISLTSFSRHQSVGMPPIQGISIRKDVIKQLGTADPNTSDLSIAVLSGGLAEADLEGVSAFERDVNIQLDLDFPIRVYLELHGCKFPTLEDFIDFGREKYIKKDLPPDHGFSDRDIDAAFSMLFSVVGSRRVD